jgi:hypothetical protein
MMPSTRYYARRGDTHRSRSTADVSGLVPRRPRPYSSDGPKVHSSLVNKAGPSQTFFTKASLNTAKPPTSAIRNIQHPDENPSKENPSLILDKEKKDEGKHDILVLRTLHTTTPIPSDPSERPTKRRMKDVPSIKKKQQPKF